MELDLKGLACPGPVLKTREAVLAEPEMMSIRVHVDNPAASENVQRFLNSQGFSVRIENEKEHLYVVWGERARESRPVVAETERSGEPMRRVLVMLTHDTMGTGDRVLGEKLMVNFVSTLKEMGADLWRVVCVNGGVKLAVSGAATLAALTELEARGVSILVCGTCLTHFDLLAHKQVGETTNMLDIVTSLELADKVISL
ncbi:MAG: sulfurtransferase-like selenium metabolism protein YedF [Deltaproteobacteria bacterium]|nr:MAG: sulfurtransferase-like selenium metabolism protein YedF [Deltaproteobacteria bacterium]